MHGWGLLPGLLSGGEVIPANCLLGWVLFRAKLSLSYREGTYEREVAQSRVRKVPAY